MAVINYSAYFDASGKSERHPVISVAGAIASKQKWKSLELEWTAVLKKYGIADFHATDFASSKGQFKLWPKGDPRRTALFKKLVKIVRSHISKYICYSMDIEAWHTVNTEFELDKHYPSPYVICACKAVGESLRISKSKHTEVFLEDGDEGFGEVQKACKRDGSIVPERLSKRGIVAFQVADLIAWKNRINITKILSLIKSEKRGLGVIVELESELESLGSALIDPDDAHLFELKNLRRTCTNMNVRTRLHPHLKLIQ